MVEKFGGKLGKVYKNNENVKDGFIFFYYLTKIYYGIQQLNGRMSRTRHKSLKHLN